MYLIQVEPVLSSILTPTSIFEIKCNLYVVILPFFLWRKLFSES